MENFKAVSLTSDKKNKQQTTKNNLREEWAI